MEEWKDIPGYEGLYQVSSEGRVRSLDRIAEHKGNKGSIFMRRWSGKILQFILSDQGYHKISLHKNQTYKLVLVHRLVAMAFIEPVEGKHTVDHSNRNKLDNRVSNLRWATTKEQNQNKSYKLSASGHKYIYFNKERNIYEVRISQAFPTLQEAIDARNALLV